MSMLRIHSAILAAVLATAGLPVVAQERSIPPTSEISDCSTDVTPGGLDSWKNFRVSCEQFKLELRKARVVSEFKWRHGYSHVSGADRSGFITLRDGVNVHWMVRPGGLALLEWPDGAKLHLVFCQCNSRSLTSSTPSLSSSIERTSQRPLHTPLPTAHIER